VTRDASRTGTSALAVVAIARVGVGAAMILAPGRFFGLSSGTEALLMRTVGIRDVVLGSGACAALAGGAQPEFRRWATFGMLSDGADLALGLRSKPLVGRKSAWIAALSPVPFLAAEIFGLTR
jgi:hypothetical protein